MTIMYSSIELETISMEESKTEDSTRSLLLDHLRVLVCGQTLLAYECNNF